MLFAVAKPTALFLNWWLGPESIALLRERDFRALLSKHVVAEGTDFVDDAGSPRMVLDAHQRSSFRQYS
jgi:hypothetical protein